jgi:hypothetical protein
MNSEQLTAPLRSRAAVPGIVSDPLSICIVVCESKWPNSRLQPGIPRANRDIGALPPIWSVHFSGVLTEVSKPNTGPGLKTQINISRFYGFKSSARETTSARISPPLRVQNELLCWAASFGSKATHFMPRAPLTIPARRPLLTVATVFDMFTTL